MYVLLKVHELISAGFGKFAACGGGGGLVEILARRPVLLVLLGFAYRCIWQRTVCLLALLPQFSLCCFSTFFCIRSRIIPGGGGTAAAAPAASGEATGAVKAMVGILDCGPVVRTPFNLLQD